MLHKIKIKIGNKTLAHLLISVQVKTIIKKFLAMKKQQIFYQGKKIDRLSTGGVFFGVWVDDPMCTFGKSNAARLWDKVPFAHNRIQIENWTSSVHWLFHPCLLKSSKTSEMKSSSWLHAPIKNLEPWSEISNSYGYISPWND